MAMGRQKGLVLALLTLSTSFDTIDDTIRNKRLPNRMDAYLLHDSSHICQTYINTLKLKVNLQDQ